jgi:hypothetical protein
MDRDQTTLIAVLFATFLAIAVALAVVLNAGPDSHPRLAGPMTTASLQSLAQRSCQCEASGKGKGCWTEFDALSEKANRGTIATACAPISTETSCELIGSDDFKDCFPIRYSVVFGGDVLCRSEDAKAAQEAYLSTFEREGGSKAKDPNPAHHKAVAAMREAIAVIRAGKKLQQHASSEGCV